jgi:hypothetical protein
MDQNLECVVRNAAADLGIGEIPRDNDFRFVDCYPNNDRAPCCGYHYNETCPGGLGEEAEPITGNNSPVRDAFNMLVTPCMGKLSFQCCRLETCASTVHA